MEDKNTQIGDIEQKNIESQQNDSHKTIHLSGMYETWFLDYASYVILERAVPAVNDGLKPVHRRILHAMKDLDDGRYNKVANIIGHTMKYHPHGDASIGDALVHLGQKELLIDAQGNWGNILTGDSAAAPRYIEARLSKFALEVLFNPKTTIWKSSYDGRNKEPLALPVKFPLLLAQGVEGIAVGLASKILPHNFNELIDASIKILNNQEFEIFPDFQTGGQIDVLKYNDGLRGGKIRIRAKIHQEDKKTIVISEIPFGTTTSSLIESIITANDKGKIKIKKIDDNTAENVEILIYLAPGVSPDTTIDALYAFTNCEVSVSPNSCIIQNDKPVFLGVKEILKISTDKTVDLLKKELEIRKKELEEQWHFASLEKIFIEKRIYRKIEECETWESVIETIDKALIPYHKLFLREITNDDIIRLTEIKIKRISKFNSYKADDIIKGIEFEIDEVKNHLANLIDFAINYFKQIKKKYGKGRERKTEIRNFDTIQASMVAAATQKLYVNREEGFAGTSLKKDEFVCDCSDIDDIVVFRDDGTLLITKVSTKTFVGKNIIHIDIFKKNDDRTIYNMIYRDGKKGKVYVKRFPVKGITRDKEYLLTKGNEDSKILYFTANPNGEAEIVKVMLRPKPKLRKLSFEYDFSELAIKGRSATGNTLTRNQVRSIVQREEGVSTLGARDIWYDDTVNRLNTEERGKYLGAFIGDEKILTVYQSGEFKVVNYDISNHFDENLILIEKFDPKRIFSVIYYDGKLKQKYIKRFQPEITNKKSLFIPESKDSKILNFSIDHFPVIKVTFDECTNKKVLEEIINIHEFIGIKSYKAKGKRISTYEVKSIKMLEPLPYEENEDLITNKSEKENISEQEILTSKENSLPENKEIKPGKPKSIKSDNSNSEKKNPQMELDF
ncbi:MAG: DNA gyrase/topoisomerase IV subunit A [Bacteroidales bacterium]|nr:DNA gyrase/topoisomerase IV subunit A [Bacteroidales bacterium]